MKSNRQTALGLLLLLVFIVNAQAQTIQFNEVVTSNSVFQDEDGDFPDWFELRNVTNNPISLLNWTCSDEPEEPAKWVFPDISLNPDAYLKVWASGKDRVRNQVFRTLINQGDTFRYLLPTQAVSGQWVSLNFDDSNWAEGPSGFGYGDGDDATVVPEGTRSIFMRRTFTVTNAADVEALILDIDYDDGFVAYINGQEIARANISGLSPAYDAPTLTDHEAQMYGGGLPDRFPVVNIDSLLQDGENVLCIQAHNVSAGSTDFSIIPFLSVVYNKASSDGITPPALLSLGDIEAYHTNFKIRSSGETLYLFDDNGLFVDSLAIPELPANVSIGIPAGQPNALQYFDQLTPGATNPASGYQGISSGNIIFSHPGGLTGPLNLSLSGVDAPATIHYTLDATPPTQASPVYTGPININGNRVVRARVYQDNFLPSPTQTRSFILNASHNLPVLLLAADPADFFDEETGIYVYGNSFEPDFPHFGANFWEDWERPIHFALYQEDRTLEAAYDAGVKIFGGWSRGQNQRSLSLFARNQYGYDEFDNAFFDQRPYDSYQAIVLRNSGNDWNNAMIRDATLTGLLRGADIEYQAYRPLVVYLNGAYWGIYNMREKINEHFLASKWGVEPDSIDLLEFGGSVIHGNNEDYLSLLDFIRTANLSTPSNFEFVNSQMDLDNYALYQAAQIYFDNTDWPGNNIKYARHKGGKWRWILFDTDFGFGVWNDFNYTNNTLAFALEPFGPNWPNPPWSTLLFRKLTQATEFRNLFVNRFADELNSRLLPERVVEHIDSLAAKIEDEIPAHFDRWNASSGNWKNRINAMKNFANRRPAQVKQNIRSEFNLPDFHQLNIKITDTAEGFVQVNSLTIEVEDWEGDYFQDVPITVTAYAKPGYVFSHWIGIPDVFSEASVQINMQLNMTIRPVFQPINTAAVVINEINYNAAADFDTGDWIELYNRSADDLNLSGWVMKDSDDSHSFVLPEGTVIEAEGFLILTRDEARFLSVFPETQTVIGDFDFGLSSNGDAVRLYDIDEILVDEVYYLPDAPWPSLPNGEGYTLELLSPELDNSLPENWSAINLHGSPNRANTTVDTSNPEGGRFQLISYPNPFSGYINLILTLKESAQVDIQLYDQNGRAIEQIQEGVLGAGKHFLYADLEHLNTGIYYAKVLVGEFEPLTVKWVKPK
ncbi:MAG: CotH kinase family protein [Saprospiraceae bacterium]|nr:CotH kinase family protein [Saprospiraceae bacterium]